MSPNFPRGHSPQSRAPGDVNVHTRKVRRRKKNSRRYKIVTIRSAGAALGITSLSAREPAPEHSAALAPGHWAIENKIHWVRDVTFHENYAQVRTGQARAYCSQSLTNTCVQEGRS